ncbi:hypothetical protein ANSO36C_51180 [Nostoc cf. commune SO-36]|uniref:Uncharacterized protein n=2 Tax=Nostoc commune TaxID=1178 RepID=A0ABN6QAP7_NOSCO|nr:hypothetical protein ANSO36C_51180 [Nostoc cf. commune SO-36]
MCDSWGAEGGFYISAIERHIKGERTISIDEMTGIQATERLEKDLPMRPGKVERREFEYIRHGSHCLIANSMLLLVKLSSRLVQIQEQKLILSFMFAEQLKLTQMPKNGI